MPSSGEVALPGVEQAPGHAVAGVKGPRGIGIACQCGRWQAFVQGIGSAEWAGRDYAEHVRIETGAQQQ